MCIHSAFAVDFNRIRSFNVKNAVEGSFFFFAGQLETNQYEDTLRETFGVNSFVAFTMDKLIQNIVRQVRKNVPYV